MSRSVFFFVALALLCVTLFFVFPQKEEKYIQPNIVTTFSVLEDITKNIIGDTASVSIQSIVPLYTDPHTYQPRPQDAKMVHNADIVIVNGWGFEGWLDKFIVASNFKGKLVPATKNLISRQEQISGSNITDPHAWHSIPHVIGYVANIEKSLSECYPSHAQEFQKNAQSYIEKLQKLDAELVNLFTSIPKDKRYVVTTHDAFWYFGDHYGIKFLSPIGTDTEQEPSAKDIKTLIKFIKENNVGAIFIENLSNTKQIQKISQEAGVEISGTLYADGLSDGKHDAATYIDMMRYNAHLIYNKIMASY